MLLLSYDAAIGSILRTLPSIIVSLEREGIERSEPTAVGLAKFVNTYSFFACCHFLHQILPHLGLIFQREGVDLSLIRPGLQFTLHQISALHDADVIGEVDVFIQHELKDHTIKESATDRTSFTEMMQTKFMDGVIEPLESYFPECDEIDAFGLFDPNKIPDKSIDPALYQSWGNDRLAILESKYSQNDNPDLQHD